MPFLPPDSSYVNGYFYFEPESSTASGNYYTNFSVLAPGLTNVVLPPKSFTDIPLTNYAIQYVTQPGDYLTSDGTIVFAVGGAVSISFISAYWINKYTDFTKDPGPPKQLGQGIQYQKFASSIYINSSGGIVPSPLGPQPSSLSVSALPKGASYVVGIMGVIGSDETTTKVTVPKGSIKLADGTIILPNGKAYTYSQYHWKGLDNSELAVIGTAPLPSSAAAEPIKPLTAQQEAAELYKELVAAMGGSWVLAFGPSAIPDLEAKMQDQIKAMQRQDTLPPPVQPWQCRIGGSLFFVPPITINVNQTFESGSLTGAAIRQISSPKFNSGHSETSITMTLYFPGIDQIWGYRGGKLKLDAYHSPDVDIDTFLASLRGLITQFRYTPFVPIVNEYLNSVWNVTSVGLRGMNISTVPDFPYLIQCDLEMVNFNHKVYLPMVATLDDAIDWGRFREFCTKAAIQMDEQANQAFALETLISSPTQGASLYQPSAAVGIDYSGSAADITGTDSVLDTSFQTALQSANYGTNNTNPSAVEFFYPTHDPAQYLGPTINLVQYGFDPSSYDSTQGLSPGNWQAILKAFNIGRAQDGYVSYGGQLPDLQQIQNIQIKNISADISFIEQYFKTFNNLLSALTDSSQFHQYANKALTTTYGNPAPGSGPWKVAMKNIEGAWYWYIWQQLTTSNNFLTELFAVQDYLRGTVEIDEWDVPMVRLSLDDNSFIVQSLSVNLGNNITRLQLQMLDQPAYQHIGGLDTTITLDVMCVGEHNLTLIRNMFDTINGLARLEHTHAILGFLGIRNLIVALAGTRYVIAKAIDVQTVPGYPHLYRVQLTFLDFDVFQQKREILSTSQEQQFAKILSKRNPFLRIQQVWSILSSYSDFPLAIKDDNGNILGYLDPDYYFKAFNIIDDDVIQNYSQLPAYIQNNSGADTSNPNSSNNTELGGGGFSAGGAAVPIPQSLGTAQPSDYQMAHHFGPLSSGGNHQWIGVTGGGGMDLLSGNNIVAQNLVFNEAQASNTQMRSIINPGVNTDSHQPYLSTPASGHIFPNFNLNADPAAPTNKQTTLSHSSMPYANNNASTVMGNFQAMLNDLQYRNLSGRMIRAFPTYMLWFIDEGGLFAGMQLFGNFYGLQSVIDFSFVANQDTLGDTLVIRISNLYSRLSTDYQEAIDPNLFPQLATLLNQQLTMTKNLASGLDPFAVANIPTLNLKPGARLHLRVGAGSNPNNLNTIFNGVITEVQQGDILTIIAQSDAVELSAIVNVTDPHGDTGHIDGCFHKDTPIHLWNGGTLSIGEIVDQDLYPIVIGLDDKGELVPATIINKFNNGPKRNWLRLEVAARGYDSWNCNYKTEIKVTDNHHILVDGKYKAAKDIKMLDKVIAKGKLPSESVLHYIQSSLLGDGSICYGAKPKSEYAPQVSTYQERHAARYEDFNKFIAHCLGICSIKPYYTMSGYGFPAVDHKTKNYSILTDLREIWYPKGVKIIPEDLSWIDDFTIAKWLMDDGSLQNKFGITFSTNSFEYEDVQRLAEVLRDNYNINSSIYWDRGWNLRTLIGRYGSSFLPSTNILEFWQRIVPHVIPSLRYKVPSKYQDMEYIDYPYGEEQYIPYETEVIDIKDWYIHGTKYGGGRVPVGYDIETTTHNYIAQGIVVHNSLLRGFYLSEPRDLIVRLLSMGNSTWEEMISYATQGMIFSQNRFGIRHFGSILYDPLSERESELKNAYQSKLGSISSMATNWLVNNQGEAGGGGGILGGIGLINPGIGSIAMQLWSNVSSDRDSEVYRRNVYPGNGLGIANYMGGDLGDGGIYSAFVAPGVNTNGQLNTPAPTELQQLRATANATQGITPQDPPGSSGTSSGSTVVPLTTAAANSLFPGLPGATNLFSQGASELHPIWTWLGLDPTVTDGVPGGKLPILGTYGPFAEVSFRAETYQKTVWDLFQTCAKLLPNYIIAVRPWMERSTVFYGKPHWAWTSGIIPITYGADVTNNSGPKVTPVNTNIQNQINKILQIQSAFNQATKTPLDIYNQIQDALNNVSYASNSNSANVSNDPATGAPANSPQTVGGDPNSNTAKTTGVYSSGNSTFEISNLPITNAQTGATLTARSGPTGLEMHLPTSATLQTDIDQHMQLASLSAQYQHPFYMARATSGSGAGGNVPDNQFNPSIPWNQQTELSTDNPSSPGQSGFMGILNPSDEQYYFCMDWSSTSAQLAGTRVLIFNPSNNTGCICTPGDKGPASSTGKISGISPDTWQILGQPGESAILWYGFVDSTLQLGPVTWQPGQTFQNKQLPTTSNTVNTDLLNAAHTNSTAGPGAGSVTVSNNIQLASVSTNTSETIPAALAQVINQKTNETFLDLARKVYGGYRSDSNAIEIFNDFQTEFATDVDLNTKSGGPNAISKNITSSTLYKIFTGQIKLNIGSGIKSFAYSVSNTKTVDQKTFVSDFQQAVSEFYLWMISNPYNIGWVVLTANDKSNKLLAGSEAVGTVLGGLPFDVFDTLASGVQSAFGATNDSILGQIARFNPVESAVRGLFSFFTGESSSAPLGWDLSNAEKLFGVWITLGPGADTGNFTDASNSTGGAIEWMIANQNPGRTASDPLGSVFTGFSNDIGKAIKGIIDIAKTAVHAVTIAISTLIDIIRFSTSLINMGVSLSGFSGQQANLLSAVLNDSYYYDPALGVGSILWQVDNCVGAETEIITYDGIKKIAEVVGTSQKLLTSAGWIEAPIKSFGKQQLWKVVLSRRNMKKTIYATAEHGWFIYGQDSQNHHIKILKQTKELIKDNHLVRQSAFYFDNDLLHTIDPWGWFVDSVEKTNKFETVYCAQVPEVHDFVLEGNILSSNCFTREYGEPVIEIREPFQRVHYINSFQHILANGIIETMSGVFTVCTASANGKAPHTAYFDKGAPSQYQYEKVVDTGLYLDSPSWYSAILHPSELIRDVIKHINNSDDGTEASRFARAELQRSLKNIYAGEIMILGDASIRPWDIIYISDTYSRITGIFEVQQVVHHFTPEIGFVTSITPAALVNVNDPERWEAGSIMQRQLAIQDLRNNIRHFGSVVNSASGAQGLSSNIDINSLIKQQEATLQGTTQFSGGASAILKDLGGSSAMGSLVGATAGLGAVAGTTGLLAAGAAIFAGWEAFKWVRDNILDVHGCSIQFLNRNGSPMDAGLSYNQGVAVGQLNVYSGLSQALGISIPLPNSINQAINGAPGPTTTNLLQNLGWQEQDITKLKTSESYWVAATKSQILGAYSPNAALMPANNGTGVTAQVTIVGIIDPITFNINVIGKGINSGSIANYNKFRLAYLVDPVNIITSSNQALALVNPITINNAQSFLTNLFFTGPEANINQNCYIRLDPSQLTDPNDPTCLIGTLFYYIAPDTITPPPSALAPQQQSDNRLQVLSTFASTVPPIGWQDTESDGTPYTLNWQMVIGGYTTIKTDLLLPTGQGAASSIMNIQSGQGK